ncbi:DUF1104 domain-containing protein [Sulfurospirillum deleyianum]|uniref:DUF1104 domain-containing protein n=1 Tax=Sulfurospirillum deleyianum (strain ATCC 51133 / DSM 6946 / 5175) TaxID=525898 RepID=D1AYZ8_SULD5|nr:DUF1104 domain-containing protein [Sulfurospirillum deleyianum]ACZ11136.1 conserved hypothetical protein [Sulfurospirillum deleyianum DSM 6946]
MKKVLFFILCTLTLMAKTDFSEMSTEELIALLGYVEPQKEERFLKELTRREESMSEEQKALYEAWKRQKSEE